MHREEDRIAPRQVAVHPFDLVGVDVGRGHLHRGRQVEDDLVRGRRVPRLGDGVADLQRKVQLGAAEHLRAVLIRPLRLGHRLGNLADQLRALHGDALDAFAVGVEHGAAEHRRRRVVHVDDRAPGAAQRFHGAADQVFARLRQHLDGHVIGDVSAFDQLAHEVVVGLGGGGEGGFDFLEADLHEHLEHAHLALGVHRLEQGLIAIAQVRAHPDRRAGEGLGRPGAIGQGDRRERAVLGGGGLQHGKCVLCDRDRLHAAGTAACAASCVAGNGLRGRPDSHGRVVWQPVGSRSDSGVRIGADMEGSRTARGLRHTSPSRRRAGQTPERRGKGDLRAYTRSRGRAADSRPGPHTGVRARK